MTNLFSPGCCCDSCVLRIYPDLLSLLDHEWVMIDDWKVLNYSLPAGDFSIRLVGSGGFPVFSDDPLDLTPRNDIKVSFALFNQENEIVVSWAVEQYTEEGNVSSQFRYILTRNFADIGSFMVSPNLGTFLQPNSRPTRVKSYIYNPLSDPQEKILDAGPITPYLANSKGLCNHTFAARKKLAILTDSASLWNGGNNETRRYAIPGSHGVRDFSQDVNYVSPSVPNQLGGNIADPFYDTPDHVYINGGYPVPNLDFTAPDMAGLRLGWKIETEGDPVIELNGNTHLSADMTRTIVVDPTPVDFLPGGFGIAPDYVLETIVMTLRVPNGVLGNVATFTIEDLVFENVPDTGVIFANELSTFHVISIPFSELPFPIETYLTNKRYTGTGTNKFGQTVRGARTTYLVTSYDENFHIVFPEDQDNDGILNTLEQQSTIRILMLAPDITVGVQPWTFYYQINDGPLIQYPNKLIGPQGLPYELYIPLETTKFRMIARKGLTILACDIERQYQEEINGSEERTNQFENPDDSDNPLNESCLTLAEKNPTCRQYAPHPVTYPFYLAPRWKLDNFEPLWNDGFTKSTTHDSDGLGPGLSIGRRAIGYSKFISGQKYDSTLNSVGYWPHGAFPYFHITPVPDFFTINYNDGHPSPVETELDISKIMRLTIGCSLVLRTQANLDPCVWDLQTEIHVNGTCFSLQENGTDYFPHKYRINEDRVAKNEYEFRVPKKLVGMQPIDPATGLPSGPYQPGFNGIVKVGYGEVVQNFTYGNVDTIKLPTWEHEPPPLSVPLKPKLRGTATLGDVKLRTPKSLVYDRTITVNTGIFEISTFFVYRYENWETLDLTNLVATLSHDIGWHP